ncbi:MAG: DNA-binding protein, partial [Halovenus sp.]
MYILDSSAFIHEYHTDESIASIPLVREELEDESAYRFDALEGSGM